MTGSQEDQYTRIQRAAEQLLAKLEQAAIELSMGTSTRREKRRQEDGEVLFELCTAEGSGCVDRAGLKQLTGVLKDLQDVLSREPESLRAEQELKMQRLSRELGEEGGSGVTVVLQGEAESYAE
jgi:hypothetical protein